MGNETPARRFPLRFSLLNLLLVTTVVALAITVVMLYLEVVPLRREVARLRDEVGELHIEDPTKLHAIRVETDNELEWKWRIWIPEGASYRLRGHGGAVPKEGYPADGGTMYLHDAGEHVVRYVIQRDPRDGRWNGALHGPHGSVGKDHQAWVEWSSRSSTSEGVGTATQSFAADQRVELMRHRVGQATNSTAIPDPADGFMIWLEPN